jgi:type I restriction enzyme S subunit
MSWPLVRLADVCSKISDGTHQAPNWATSGVPFLFVSNVRNGSISFDTNKFVSKDEYQKLTKHSPIEAGDVLYTAVGSYGNSAVVPHGKTFVFQRHIAHIKPNRNLLDAAYLSQMLETPPLKRQADRAARGVAQKTVTLSSLRKFEIPLPPLDDRGDLGQSGCAKPQAQARPRPARKTHAVNLSGNVW